jgi:hypothetical protein
LGLVPALMLVFLIFMVRFFRWWVEELVGASDCAARPDRSTLCVRSCRCQCGREQITQCSRGRSRDAHVRNERAARVLLLRPFLGRSSGLDVRVLDSHGESLSSVSGSLPKRATVPLARPIDTMCRRSALPTRFACVHALLIFQLTQCSCSRAGSSANGALR